MGKIIDLKIDEKTLPKDGQQIAWQTQRDFDNEIWKTGTFESGDNLFTEGFEQTSSKWDLSWQVLHWRELCYKTNKVCLHDCKAQCRDSC